MYKEKLIVAIKHNGKILRENKDVVLLPFGSEFSVLVKNLNSKRVKFTLSIDGTNALDDAELIVNANSETEVKRFIRNGNMNEGNAFKFIERTKSIEDGPRGIKVDDGVVRVEFWFEQDKPELDVGRIYWNNNPFNGYPPRNDIWCSASGATNIESSILRGSINQISTQNMAVPCSATTTSAVDQILANKSEILPNDAGITVPGSKVDQKFTAVYGFKSERNSHVIILRMVGIIAGVNVIAPITVKTKNICSVCSHTNKSNAKFCSQCGTSLILI